MIKRELSPFGEGYMKDTNQGIKDEDKEKGKKNQENKGLGEINLFKFFTPHPLPLSLLSIRIIQ